MELLLRIADERETGAGVLARMWMVERLRAETSGTANYMKELNKRLILVEEKIARYQTKLR